MNERRFLLPDSPATRAFAATLLAEHERQQQAAQSKTAGALTPTAVPVP